MGLLTQKERRGRTYVQPQSSGLLTAVRRMRGLLSDAADWAGDNPLDAAALATSPIPIIGDVVGGVADAKAFYDDPSWMNAGLGLAGLLPFVPGGLAGTFAGVGAKTADMLALRKAEAMEAAGESADDIWRATGWGRGADENWRFEIDDSQAGPWLADETVRPMMDVMAHDRLYDAYPDIAIGTRGTESSRLAGGAEYNSLDDVVSVSRNADDSSALHELQHAVQSREGFARGGNPGEFVSQVVKELNDIDYQIDDINNELRQIARRTDNSPTPQRYYDLMDARSDLVQKRKKIYQGEEMLGDTMGGANKRYRSLSGEVEARNVQTRMNMDAQARRQTPPWATEDVPRDQQIVRHR